MATNYVKLDMKVFKDRLGSKQYKYATGARRAVGKSEMSQADKESCYASINKHFGVSDKPAKAASVKRPAAKKTAVKATTKTPKAGRGKRTAATKKGTSARGKTSDAEGAPAAQELAELQAGAAATQAAMAGLATASELDPGLDVKAAIKQGAEILQHSIDRIGLLLGRKVAVLPEVPEPAPVSEPPPSEPPVEDEEDEEKDDANESA